MEIPLHFVLSSAPEKTRNFFAENWRKVGKLSGGADAVAFETVPAARWKRKYILRKALLRGATAGLRKNTFGVVKSLVSDSLASEARDQYTLGYLTSESFYDDKFRNIDVRVDRPNVNVIAKRGYYPSAQDFK
ncbi:MAG: hypothetical protein WDM87_05130 [Terracidiphilus sp.]